VVGEGGGTFRREVGVLVGGTALAQLVTVLAAPVLTRLYTATDFGVLAVYAAVASLVATLVTLRYETAIMLPSAEREASALVRISMGLALGLGATLTLATLALPTDQRALLGVSGLDGWLPIAVLNGIGLAVIAIGSSWFNRRRNYGRIATTRFVQAGLNVGGAICLGIWGLDSGLLTAQAVAAAAAVSIVALPLVRATRGGKFNEMSEVARNHGRTPKFLLPTAFLDHFTTVLPVFLIASWFGEDAAGEFSLAWRILALPLMLFGVAVGQVFYQRFARALEGGRVTPGLLYKTWRTLLLIGVGPTLVILFSGPALFSWAFGEEWWEAGRLASALSPMLLAMFVSSPTSSAFLVLGMQRHTLVFGLAIAIYRPAILLVGYAVNNLVLACAIWSLVEILMIFIYNGVAVAALKRTLAQQSEQGGG
jgi:O-antigen/teichoic acid export membrane protein